MQKPEVMVAAVAFMTATGTAIYVSKQDNIQRPEFVESVKAIGTCSNTIDRCQKIVKKHAVSIDDIQQQISELTSANERLQDIITTMIEAMGTKGIEVPMEPEYRPPNVTATPHRDSRRSTHHTTRAPEKKVRGGRGNQPPPHAHSRVRNAKHEESLSDDDSDTDVEEDDDSWDESIAQARSRGQRRKGR